MSKCWREELLPYCQLLRTPGHEWRSWCNWTKYSLLILGSNLSVWIMDIHSICWYQTPGTHMKKYQLTILVCQKHHCGRERTPWWALVLFIDQMFPLNVSFSVVWLTLCALSLVGCVGLLQTGDDWVSRGLLLGGPTAPSCDQSALSDPLTPR